ncbi:SRPBCC family protein [Halospeciosus flavus]|uniref:SRPBCC family protein n=1 Tax=Halospeciosus flavus TaxID=3032283 RepID=A0ABD5Z228_9EURY|nr:SRPBCC family protein [Halospeciosus flavus]
MESVTVSRQVDADPETVRAAMQDVGEFMRAAGFDEVVVEGDRIELTNRLGLVEIELTLEVVEREGADLAYVQRDGIFREMWTEYRVESADGGTAVEATTEFELAAKFVGPIFDSTVVKRQRRKELTAQFDSLAEL